MASLSVWEWALIALGVGLAVAFGVILLIGRALREYDRSFPLECFLVAAFLFLPAPSWAQFPEIVATMTAQRASKPTPMSKAQLSDMLNRTALQHPGWGMLRKDGGNNCPTPYPGISISCDWLMNIPTAYGADFVVDAENTAVIQVGNQGPLQAGQEIIQPWPVDGPGDPGGGGGGQTTTGITITQVRDVVHDEIQTIWAQNERIFANVIDNLNAIQGKQDAFKDQLTAHDEKTSKVVAFFSDPKTLTALISGALAYFTAKKM